MNKFLTPTENFAAVRDGRRSLPLWFDVDLSTLRNDTASNPALIIQVAGTVMYFDANPDDGNAVIEFQDTSYDRASVPFYASPGAIFRVPFTQIKITNTAQTGKKLRVIYGVDADFTPGALTQIAFAGTVSLSAQTLLDERTPLASTGNWEHTSALSANTPVTIFAPGVNVNGAILLTANMSQNGTDFAAVVANSVAPSSITGGEMIVQTDTIVGSASYNYSGFNLKSPQLIAAGKGLYFISAGAISSTGVRSARWKML